MNNYAEIPIINRMTIVLDEILSSPNGLKATDILEKIKLPKTTLYRLLQSMVDNGFIIHHKDTNVYKIGYKFAESYQIVNLKFEKLKDIAHPYLKSLADSVQETVKLSVLSGMQAFTLISIEGSRPIRINIDTGALFPLNAGASGKILMSSLSSSEIEYYMQKYAKKYTENSIITLEGVKQEFDFINKNGFAKDDGEYLPEICAIAVPIYGEGKNIIAAISVAYPTMNRDIENMDTMISHTKKTAEIISILMQKESTSSLPAKLISGSSRIFLRQS